MSKLYPSQAVLSRRDLIAAAGAVAVVGSSVLVRPALAKPADVAKAVKAMIGDKTATPGKINLKTPQIAENGNTVPISISVESPMTAGNYVKSVHLFAEGNPNPNVASFHFTPQSGKAMVSTRMRMIKTQNLVAVAEMSDGSVWSTKKQVKVTIGGCGG